MGTCPHHPFSRAMFMGDVVDSRVFNIFVLVASSQTCPTITWLWVSGYTCPRIRDLPSWPVQCRSHQVGHWHPAAYYERCCAGRQWNKKVRPWPDSNDLHWLDVTNWVTYKPGVIMHRCRHGKAPPYLVDCCTPVTNVVGRQRLRSATQQLMVVPRHQLSTVGRRAFAVHGPMVWNSLLHDLCTQWDYESFRPGLKTHLFSRY